MRAHGNSNPGVRSSPVPDEPYRQGGGGSVRHGKVRAGGSRRSAAGPAARRSARFQTD